MEALICLKEWKKGIRIKHIAHSYAASKCSNMDMAINMCVIMSTAIVGTSLITQFSNPDAPLAQHAIAGVLSFLAAGLTSMQTYLKLSERAQAHKIISNKYGQLRREIEEELVTITSEEEAKKFMDIVRTKWDEIDAEAPILNQRIFDMALKSTEQSKKNYAHIGADDSGSMNM